MTPEAVAEALRASGEAVALPGAPALPGLAFRHWRDERDVDACAAILNASFEADGLVMRTSVVNEANELRHLAGLDLERDLVLAEIGGRPAGFARVNVETEDDGTRRHWTTVMPAPDHRDRALLAVLMGWAEGRHREKAAAEPDAPRRFAAWAAEREAWWIGFLEGRGYRPARWFTDMVRDTLDDLPERPLPAGLEIRPVRPEDMRTILAAEDEAFRDHWGHHAMTEEDVAGVLEHPHTDPSLWVAAWDGDAVAGMVIGSVMHDDNAAFGWRRGWLGAVGTRRPWRNRGLASALMVETMRRMRDRGLTSVALGVDTENPSGALGLYERLGFRTDQRFTILYRPFEA